MTTTYQCDVCREFVEEEKYQHSCINCLYAYHPPKSIDDYWACLITYAIISDPNAPSCNEWAPNRPKCLDEEVEKERK